MAAFINPDPGRAFLISANSGNLVAAGGGGAAAGLWLRGVPHVSRFLEVLPPDPSVPSAGSSRANSPTAEDAEAEAAAGAAAAAAGAFLPEMRREELLTVAQSARQGCEGKWLVFANEGSSLTHLFFVADAGGSGLLEPVRLCRPKEETPAVAFIARRAGLGGSVCLFGLTALV